MRRRRDRAASLTKRQGSSALFERNRRQWPDCETERSLAGDEEGNPDLDLPNHGGKPPLTGSWGQKDVQTVRTPTLGFTHLPPGRWKRWRCLQQSWSKTSLKHPGVPKFAIWTFINVLWTLLENNTQITLICRFPAMVHSQATPYNHIFYSHPPALVTIYITKSIEYLPIIFMTSPSLQTTILTECCCGLVVQRPYSEFRRFAWLKHR